MRATAAAEVRRRTHGNPVIRLLTSAPTNDPTFDRMEQIGMVAASPHVANPCGTFGRRTEWSSEPVEFWRQQHAWENVLKKHPRRVVVNAHMLWLCYSDEQLDYLRYMLTTYPNLNVDLATTPNFLHAVGRDSLREFIPAPPPTPCRDGRAGGRPG